MAGEVVGTAYVEIRPKVDGFAAEAQSKITSPLNAAFAGIATGVAAKKVADFFGSAISEAQSAAKVSAQTAAVLKMTGEAAGISADHVAELAGRLSELAAVDDEVIQQGENVLLTFTNIRNEAGKGNDVFDQATEAALDLSVALGTDMQGAVIQVGKALNDPIAGVTALTRVGVSFSAQQKEVIKTLVETGDTLGAQKIILAELNKEFGGAAASQSTSAKRLALAFANVKESIGAALLPAIEALAKALTPLAKFFSENQVAATALAVVLSGALLAALLAWTINAAKSTLTTLGFAAAQKESAAAATTNAGALRGVALAAAPYVAVAALAVGAAVGLHQAFTNSNGTMTVYAQNLTKLTDAQLKRAAAVILSQGGEKDFQNAVKQTAAISEQTARTLVAGADLPKKKKQELIEIIEREIRQQERAAAAAGTATGAIEEQTDATKAAADAAKAWNDGMDEQINRQLGVEGAAINMDRAIADFNDTMKDTNITTLEGRDAFNNTKSSLVEFGQKVRDEALGSFKSLEDATRDQIGALEGVRDTLAPGSPLRAFLDGYINDLTNRIPGEVYTRFKAEVAYVSGVSVETLNFLDANPVFLAAGGYVPPRPGGTPAVIGEGGEGEYVIPESQIRTVPTGGDTYNVYIDRSRDPLDVAVDLARQKANAMFLAGI